MVLARALRRWWRMNDRHQQMSAYLAARRLQRPLQWVMAGILVSYGMAAVAILAASDRPTGVSVDVVAVTIGAFAVTAAGCWLYRWPTRALSVWFVFSSATAMAVTCLVHPSAVLAMLGASGFGILGGYVAFFHSARAMAIVVLGALVTTSVTQARMAVSGNAVMLLGTLPAVLIAMVSFPFAVQILVRQLGADAQSSTTDPLTGLLNRRGFYLAVRGLAARMARGDRDEQLAVALVDLDHFKKVNDTLGHDAGDHLLVSVGARLQGASADGSVEARIGGEEFLVAEVGRGPVSDLGERLLAAVIQADPAVTASVGIGVTRSMPADPEQARELLDQLVASADAAMYEAKRAGGNRLCCAPAESVADRDRGSGAARPRIG